MKGIFISVVLCLGIMSGLWARSSAQTHLMQVNGQVVDSLTNEPLAGAVVTLINPFEDKLMVMNLTTDKNGRFDFQYINELRCRIEISFLGYKQNQIELPVGELYVNLGKIKMAPDVQEIDDIVVRSRIQMYRFKGDTIVFFPASVSTMEGDDVLAILRQMPGVKVDDAGNVEIMGKKVERSYVNGRLLFGDNPVDALQNIEAKDVMSIQAYDEVDEYSELTQGKHARKRKVLNILTFDKFDTSVAGKASAAMGADFAKDIDGSRPIRYEADANLNYFSERRQAKFLGMANNFQRSMEGVGTPGDVRQGVVNLNYADKLSKENAYTLSYSYTDDKITQRAISRQTYFPSTEYVSRIFGDTSDYQTRRYTHRFQGNFSRVTSNFSADLSANGQYGGSEDENTRAFLSELDGAPLTRIHQRSGEHRDSYSVALRASFQHKFERSSLKYALRGSLSNSNRKELRVDTAFRLSNKTILQIDGDEESYSMDANLGYTLRFEKTGNIDIGANVTYRNGLVHRLAVDDLSGQIDTTLTRSTTSRNTTLESQISYHFSNEKWRFIFSPDFQVVRQSLDKRFR